MIHKKITAVVKSLSLEDFIFMAGKGSGEVSSLELSAGKVRDKRLLFREKMVYYL